MYSVFLVFGIVDSLPHGGIEREGAVLISLSNSVRTKNAIHTNVLVNLCA